MAALRLGLRDEAGLVLGLAKAGMSGGKAVAHNPSMAGIDDPATSTVQPS
jgi:hypothetical protein